MLKDAQGAARSSLFGDLFVLLGTVFAVFYVLLSKQQIATAKPLQLTTSQQVGAIVTVLYFSALSPINSSYEVSAASISLQFWLLAVISGIMQYGLAFLLYLMAIQNVPVSQAAFYVALIPIFGVTSAILLIGEHPSFAQWIGSCISNCLVLFCQQTQHRVGKTTSITGSIVQKPREISPSRAIASHHPSYKMSNIILSHAPRSKYGTRNFSGRCFYK